MEIYKLGPDEPYDLNYLPDDSDWVVYYYENTGYEGYGQLVYQHQEKLFTLNLCHCSCYGPLEGLPGLLISKEDILGNHVSLGYFEKQEVLDKVAELLRAGQISHPDLQVST